MPDEGMPIHGRPYSKGNLYIRFTVAMPDVIPEQLLEQLAAVLPDDGESEVMDTDDAEETNLQGAAPLFV